EVIAAASSMTNRMSGVWLAGEGGGELVPDQSRGRPNALSVWKKSKRTDLVSVEKHSPLALEEELSKLKSTIRLLVPSYWNGVSKRKVTQPNAAIFSARW